MYCEYHRLPEANKTSQKNKLKVYFETLSFIGLRFDLLIGKFSGITDALKLRVSTVIQKAFIEVNEEGSEAAAATAIVMEACSFSISPKFDCDRPFLYFIKDMLTGLILFAGRVANPMKN